MDPEISARGDQRAHRNVGHVLWAWFTFLPPPLSPLDHCLAVPGLSDLPTRQTKERPPDISSCLSLILPSITHTVTYTMSRRATSSISRALPRSTRASCSTSRCFSSSTLIPDEPARPTVVTDSVPGPKGHAAVSGPGLVDLADKLMSSPKGSTRSKTTGHTYLLAIMKSPAVSSPHWLIVGGVTVS